MQLPVVYLLLIFLLIKSPTIRAEEPQGLDSFKEVLQNDLLAEELKKQEEKKKQQNIEENNRLMKKFQLPQDKDLWSVLSEFWLMKNAALLNWDFVHPEYDLEKTFVQVIEEVGMYEQKVKVLAINNADFFHFSLPANQYEMILVVSIPFVRSLNLTKQEIALLMLEDCLRQELHYMKDFVLPKELKELLGQNTYPKMVDKRFGQEIFSNYEFFLKKRGYTFQEQFEVTKKMKVYLSAHSQYMQLYIGLLGKIDSLQKSNPLYKNYSKIYPSPEIQLKWLKDF